MIKRIIILTILYIVIFGVSSLIAGSLSFSTLNYMLNNEWVWFY